jgi:hypothetical protein
MATRNSEPLSPLFFTFIAFFILFTFAPSYAQKDLGPGYIIDNKGDTIHGFILYRDGNMGESCNFRPSPQLKGINYLPSEIRAFRIDEGKYFISRMAPVFDKQELIFLEYLIKGKLNVYFFHDNTDHYYTEKEGGPLVELTEKETIYRDKYNDPIYKRNLYQGKLKSQLSDCMTVVPMADQTRLEHKSLIRMAQTYHLAVCTDEQCVIFEKKAKKAILLTHVNASLIYNKLIFGETLTYDYRMGASLGVGFELSQFLDWSPHTSLMLDLDFQKFSNYLLSCKEYATLTYNGKNLSLSIYNQTGSIEVDTKMLALSMPFSVNQTFQMKKISPTIGVGVINTFILSQNKELLIDDFAAEFGQSVPFYNIGFQLKGGIKMALRERNFLFAGLTGAYKSSLNLNKSLRFHQLSGSFTLGYSF